MRHCTPNILQNEHFEDVLTNLKQGGVSVSDTTSCPSIRGMYLKMLGRLKAILSNNSLNSFPTVQLTFLFLFIVLLAITVIDGQRPHLEV